MPTFLKFLNDNAGALNALFSGVVMIATTVYAVLTWKLVSETRRMRQVQTEPVLHVSLESSEFAINLMRLRIENIGSGPAKDIRISLRPISGGTAAQQLVDDFGQSNFFKTGLANLGPGQHRYSHYTNLHENGDAKLSSCIGVELHYSGMSDGKYLGTFSLDLSERKNDYTLGTPPLQSMAKSLEKVQRDLAKVLSHNRLRVDVYTEAERQRWNDEWMYDHGRKVRVRRVSRRRTR